MNDAIKRVGPSDMMSHSAVKREGRWRGVNGTGQKKSRLRVISDAKTAQGGR
jgi:hypothetical protein